MPLLCEHMYIYIHTYIHDHTWMCVCVCPYHIIYHPCCWCACISHVCWNLLMIATATVNSGPVTHGFQLPFLNLHSMGIPTAPAPATKHGRQLLPRMEISREYHGDRSPICHQYCLGISLYHWIGFWEGRKSLVGFYIKEWFPKIWTWVWTGCLRIWHK